MNKIFFIENTALERWVARQRSDKKADRLNEYRVQKLEGIGFPWAPYADAWTVRYEEYKVNL